MKTETLKELGFYPIKPIGNINSIWYKNDDLDILFYSNPTESLFLATLIESGYIKGSIDTKQKIQKSLGLLP